MQKLNDNVTKPVFSEPLTRPIRVNIDMNEKQPESIQTETELRNYLTDTYHLPINWDKQISLVRVKMDKEDQVIALVLTENEKKDMYEEEKVVYLKKQAKHPYLLESMYKLPEKNGSVLQLVHKNNNQDKLKMVEKSVNKKIDDLIFQQKKIEKVQSDSVIVKNEVIFKEFEKSKEEGMSSASREANIEKRLRDVLLHAKSGTVVILHINQLIGKKPKPLKVKIPEFKSRGFRFTRTILN